MNMIEKAIRYASDLYAGQTDKSGLPLILHPLYVMSKMKNEEARTVAVLYNILEYTNKTADDLKAEGFSDDVVNAVVMLTRAKEEPDKDGKDERYFEYIRQILSNELAVEVKLGDLEHNMDISRIPNPIEEDYERLKKYKKAYAMLIIGQRQKKIEREFAALDRENSSDYAKQAI